MTTYQSIESARQIRDISNAAIVNPRLRDHSVIVHAPDSGFYVVSLGFASAFDLEIVK